jgi:hypothetical protein
LAIVDEFATSYQSNKVIWWPARQCFLFDMFNHSLRFMEADIMADMSFFIRDLHQPIDRLHRKQLSSYHGKPFTVYRGQGLCNKDFQKIRQPQDSLICFNSFLPASTVSFVSETLTGI